jgi:hypothetical protein
MVLPLPQMKALAETMLAPHAIVRAWMDIESN